jgi:hypothetical protein
MTTKHRQTSKRSLRPLRRGGITHRTWDLLDAGERDEIARRAGVPDGDLAALARTNCSTTTRSRVFEALTDPVCDAITDALGAASANPSADDLVAAADAIADDHTPAEIRLLFACVVEWCLPARRSVLELAAMDERFAIAPVDGAATIPHRDGRCASPDTRAERRARRERLAAEQAQRRLQQHTGRESTKAFACRSADTAPAEAPADEAVDIDLMAPTRLVDRRLPPEADGSSRPVGWIGSAYITWGPDGRYGKRRPVVIVGVSDDHLWVRPCYSNDDCAGRWRAAAIDDWAECGLDHTSYVDLEVRRLPRHAVKIGPRRLTLHDWNRICRGEVHPT